MCTRINFGGSRGSISKTAMHCTVERGIATPVSICLFDDGVYDIIANRWKRQSARNYGVDRIDTVWAIASAICLCGELRGYLILQYSQTTPYSSNVSSRLLNHGYISLEE